MGVNCNLITSKNLDSIQQFMRLYNQYINMVREYVEKELPSKSKA